MAQIKPKKAAARLAGRQEHYDRLMKKMPDRMLGNKRPGSNKQ
jgi:hypothetical protein